MTDGLAIRFEDYVRFQTALHTAEAAAHAARAQEVARRLDLLDTRRAVETWAERTFIRETVYAARHETLLGLHTQLEEALGRLADRVELLDARSAERISALAVQKADRTEVTQLADRVGALERNTARMLGIGSVLVLASGFAGGLILKLL